MRAMLPFMAALAIPAPFALSPAAAVPNDIAARREARDVTTRRMHEFTRCIVERQYEAAKRLIETEPQSRTHNARANNLMWPACLEGAVRMRFQPHILRAGLYEWLYRRDFADQDVSLDRVPAIGYPWSPSSISAAARESIGSVLARGECVVRGAPAAARALMLTDVTGEAEQQAFEALRPQLVACVGEQEIDAQSRPVLRGMIAEAFYHLSLATRHRSLEAAE